MLHGVTEADYQRELAKSCDNEVRHATLQTTKEIVELLEFQHIDSPYDLRRFLQLAEQKVRVLEVITNRQPGPDSP